jgi:hypothetical protein
MPEHQLFTIGFMSEQHCFFVVPAETLEVIVVLAQSESAEQDVTAIPFCINLQ